MSDPTWDEWVDHVRRDAMVKIAGASAFVAIVPEEPDVKAAVELGLAILLDKPIVSVVMPGRGISDHLARVSDRVIYADIDTKEGAELVARELRGAVFPAGE